MHGKLQPQQSKFVGDRPFGNPEAAAKVLLEIYRQYMALRPDDGYTHTGVTNREFIQIRGGSVEEYAAGVKYGLEQKWFRFVAGSRVYVMAEPNDLPHT